jgi:hypothetical protein
MTISAMSLPRLECGSPQLARIREWMFERARWHASITDEWLHLVVDDISIAPVAARLLRGTSADYRRRRRRPLFLGVGRPSRSRPAKGQMRRQRLLVAVPTKSRS